MPTIISAKQSIFFSENGYLEIEDPMAEMIIQEVKQTLPENSFLKGRDLWRRSKVLEKFLTRQIKDTLFSLVHEKALRLAFDQWIPKGTLFEEKTPLSKLFSIQGLAIGFFISADRCELAPSSLGLSPFPKEKEGLLFVRPNLLIDWPKLKEPLAQDLYFVAYAIDRSVYVYNPKDPLTHLLKDLGYQFGDCLNNQQNPFLIPFR